MGRREVGSVLDLMLGHLGFVAGAFFCLVLVLFGMGGSKPKRIELGLNSRNK